MNTILFDLDGTLLPMDDQLFMMNYITQLLGLVRRSPFNMEISRFTQALEYATGACLNNDGAMTNFERFFTAFQDKFGPYNGILDTLFMGYFASGLYIPEDIIYPNPYAKKCVELAKEKGYTVVLATNPFSPQVATYSRMCAAGLDTTDFLLVTTMENSHYCKPKQEYYEEILKTIGREPRECLMVGNDVSEDMWVRQMGMDVYLVDTHMLNRKNLPVDDLEKGSLENLYEKIKNMKDAL